MVLPGRRCVLIGKIKSCPIYFCNFHCLFVSEFIGTYTENSMLDRTITSQLSAWILNFCDTLLMGFIRSLY